MFYQNYEVIMKYNRLIIGVEGIRGAFQILINNKER